MEQGASEYVLHEVRQRSPVTSGCMSESLYLLKVHKYSRSGTLISLILSVAMSNNLSSTESQGPDESTDDNNSNVSSGLGARGIPATEIQSYFRIENSRIFHSHGDLPYPLPVDWWENEVREFDNSPPLTTWS